jgi:hypothetical protein
MPEKRVQLSLPFDEYKDILVQAKNFCKNNRITLKDFTAQCYEEGLKNKLGLISRVDDSLLARMEPRFEKLEARLQDVEHILGKSQTSLIPRRTNKS